MVSPCFFPRAFERRVLLIVAVCQTFSHLHITSSNPHIFSSSRPHIFTSSHLHIFSSSHLHIFISSHLLIFTSSHSLLPSCSLALLLSCPLALLPSSFSLLLFYFYLKARGSATRRHETQPFRTKRGWIAKTEVKMRFYNLGGNLFARNKLRSPKTEVKLQFSRVRRNHFAPRSSKAEVKWHFLYDNMALAAGCSDSYVLMSKRVVKLRFRKFARNPFARNDGWVSKTGVKLRFWRSARNYFARNGGVKNWGEIVLNWGEIAIAEVGAQPFRTKWCLRVKNWNEKLRFRRSARNPFARNGGRVSKIGVKLRFRRLGRNTFTRNGGRVSKTEVKLRFWRSARGPFARKDARVSKTVCGRWKLVCKRVCA